MKSVLLLFIGASTLCCATPSAEEIMRRVAENQDRAQQARKSYVYDMDVFVRMKRANGKVAREETRNYVVAPGEKGARRKLGKVEGKIFDGAKVQEYHEAGYRTKDSDIDGAVTDSFAREVLWRKGGFGPAIDWFPVGKDEAKRYTFTFVGEEKYRDFDVYNVAYKPKDKDDCWSGEVLVERNEMQPVLVTSEWACRIPAAVKVMLGTNVQHVGAKISYERFDKDVWFPVKCGGEMKVRVLFLYARTIAFSAANGGFRKADVQSSIEFEEDDKQTPGRQD